jgi:hypothetical protein
MQLYKVFSQQAGRIVGEKSTVTTAADVAGNTNGHSFKFYLKGETGTEQSFWLWLHVTGLAELNPVTGVFRGIEVTYASGSTDVVIGAAIRAAIKADGMAYGLSLVTGATNQVVITGRFPFDTTNIADVDTGWTIVTTTAGSATVTLNANVDGSATSQAFVVRPPRAGSTSLIYLRRVILSVGDSALTDATTYGAVAGLTNGIQILLRDHDAATLATICTTIKNNGSVITLGRAMQFGTLELAIEIDLVGMFGGELPIDGSKGQELAFMINDNVTGLDGHYLSCFGHYTQSVS